jgi:DNA-binding transcriptional regulator PaaX
VVVALRDASAGLGDLLSAAAAVTGWLDVDASASTRLIEHAWDLPALAGRYGDVISRLDAMIKTAEADPLVAFRSLYEASSEAYQLLGEEGSLPRVALPEDWPAGRLGEALGRVLALLGPAATGHADAVINASRHAALAERDPGWG